MDCEDKYLAHIIYDATFENSFELMFSCYVQLSLKSQVHYSSCTHAVTHYVPKQNGEIVHFHLSTLTLIRITRVGFSDRRKVPSKFSVVLNKAQNKIIQWCQNSLIVSNFRAGFPQST